MYYNITNFLPEAFSTGSTYSGSWDGGTVQTQAKEYAVLIYDGIMPDVEQFVASFIDSGNYASLTESLKYSITGTETLCGYNNFSVDYNISNNGYTIYTTDATMDSHYVRDGTATWACIFTNQGVSSTKWRIGYSSSDDGRYVALVDVSDATGNGIVKLGTLVVNTQAPILADLSVSFGGGN